MNPAITIIFSLIAMVKIQINEVDWFFGFCLGIALMGVFI